MEFIFLIVILIFSVVLHEVSHGVVANRLGDPTAKLAGRITLNPIPHLDMVGSVLLPGFLIIMSQLTGGGIIFGWAKPVPVNPANLKGKYDSALVSLAGPGSNLAVAIVFGLALRFLPLAELHPALLAVFSYIVFLNILLAVFNLLPVPPLDGSHILFTFLPDTFNWLKDFLARYGIFAVLFLIFFFFQYVALVVDFIFQIIVGTSFLY